MFILDLLYFTLSDLVTVPPQSNVTEKGLIESTESGLTTSPTNEHSTTDTDVTWTMSTGTELPHNLNSSDVITAGENVTSHTGYTQTSVTSPPATHTDPYHFNNSSDQEINPTRTLNTSPFSDQSVASNLSTSDGSTVFRPTEEMRNESVLHTVRPDVNASTSPEESSTLGSVTENSDNPDATPTLSAGNMVAIEEEEEGNDYFTVDICWQIPPSHEYIVSMIESVAKLRKRKKYYDQQCIIICVSLSETLDQDPFVGLKLTI